MSVQKDPVVVETPVLPAEDAIMYLSLNGVLALVMLSLLAMTAGSNLSSAIGEAPYSAAREVMEVFFLLPCVAIAFRLRMGILAIAPAGLLIYTLLRLSIG